MLWISLIPPETSLPGCQLRKFKGLWSDHCQPPETSSWFKPIQKISAMPSLALFLRKQLVQNAHLLLVSFKLKMWSGRACIWGEKDCYYHQTRKLSWTEEEFTHTCLPSQYLQMSVLWFYIPKGTLVIPPGQAGTSVRTIS